MALFQPVPALRPWVAAFWANEAGTATSSAREWVLPDGHAHLAIRLAAQPLRLFDAHGTACDIADAVLAGPYDRAYQKDVSIRPASVGALLRPGALRALLGVPAALVFNQHVPLESLWGASARDLVAQMNLASTANARIACLEAALLARVPGLHGLHPPVAAALDGLARGQRVEVLARDAGYSQRRFTDLFRQGIGMPPKRYACLQRFNRILPAAVADTPWVDLAQAGGYSDQAHFVRDFRSFAGMSPGAYRRALPTGLRHVRVSAPATR